MVKGLCVTTKIESFRHRLQLVTEAALSNDQVSTANRCIDTLYQGMLWANDLLVPSASLSLINDEYIFGVFRKAFCTTALSGKNPHILDSFLATGSRDDKSDGYHSFNHAEAVILFDKEASKLYSSLGSFQLRRWCVVPAIIHILSYYAGYDTLSIQFHLDRLTAVEALNDYLRRNYPQDLEIFYSPDSPLNLELMQDSSTPHLQELAGLLKAV
jgi:hypothetical protein